jgi:hypothetical protein
MANARVAYTGLRNPGMVRKITKADFKAAGFPGVPELTWDQSNSWRVFLEDAEPDLIDFLKEQSDLRVTNVAPEDDEADAKETAKDERASRKAAAEMDTEPVDGGGHPAPSGSAVGSSSTVTQTTGTAGNGSST